MRKRKRYPVMHVEYRNASRLGYQGWWGPPGKIKHAFPGFYVAVFSEPKKKRPKKLVIKNNFVEQRLVYPIEHIYETCRLDTKQPSLVISVYLSSLPVSHPSDAPRRRLVVTGIVQGYRT